MARRASWEAHGHPGAGAAAVYAHRSFRIKEGERCGAHDPRGYLRRVDEMRAVFTLLARADADEVAGDAAGDAQ